MNNTNTTQAIFYENPLVVKLVAALLIILAGIILAKLASKLAKHLLHNINLDKNAKKAIGKHILLEKTISNITSILIVTASIIIALEQLTITKYVLLSILSIATLLILISLLLNIKDLLPNIHAGITFIGDKNIKKGKKLKLKRAQGTITHVGLLKTIIKDEEDHYIIPNKLIKKAKEKNKK